jgi:hypothetical protein
MLDMGGKSQEDEHINVRVKDYGRKDESRRKYERKEMRELF